MKLKKVLACLLSVLMVLSVIPMTVFAEAGVGFDNFKAVKTYTDDTFEDVEDDDWYAENVESVYEFGIMVGRSENSFVAEDNMTLAEAMTIAARLNAIYNTGKAEFAVTDPWYKAYTDYCKNAGIADLANDDPDEAVTRGKFADIFANALPKEALKEINEVDGGAIPDVKEDDTFGKAIYALYRAGVLVGNDKKGTFAPDSFIKRMEVAAIAGRMAVPGDRETITLKNEKSYTVLFDVNYDDKTPDEVTVADGETVAAPKDPTRTGYTFAGWYTAETGGKKFDFEKAITKDTTVYAHWTKVSSGGGGGGGGGSSSSKKTIEKLLSTVDFPVETDLNNLTNDEDWRAGSGLYCFVLDVDNDGTVEKYLMLYDKKNMTSVSLPITASMKKSGSNYVLNLDDVKLVFETEGGKVVGVTISGLTEDCEVFNDKTFTAPEYKSMEEILATNPDVPTSEGSTAPANAWINANNNSFKAFLGVEEETDLFMFRHPTEFTWGIGMTESFLKDGDNYVFEDEINHVTFTVVMEDGTFTSVNIETENEKFKDMAGAYGAPGRKTLGDILATIPGIPTSPDETVPEDAWTNMDNPDAKTFMGYNSASGSERLIFKDSERQYWLDMTDEFLCFDDQYVFNGRSSKTTLYVEDGEIVSIEIDMIDPKGESLSGVYAAKLPVEYMDWDGEKLVEKSTTEAIEVTDATTTLEAGKFYVVNGEVTIGTLTVQGTKENPTTLILADGAKLTVTGEEESAGISISSANALVITGQSGNTGELIANGGRYGAGIGGNDCCDNGNLTINGGTVTANGGEYAAGIGGGDDGHGGTVTINDGTVTAKGQSRGAGIGGGNNGNGSIVTINGGTVTATGGDDGKAMGGDTFMDDGSVTFGEDMNFIIKAGDDKDSAKSMTAAEYAEDHSAKYIGIRGLTEPNTIADILDLFGTDFPITGDSGIPKGAWETEDGAKACYRYISGSEDIFKATASDFASLVSCSESVTQSGTDYVYAKGTITWTFAVTDKKITSITASGTSQFDGTYAPAPEKRDLGSIVSTVKDFPSNPEAGMPAPSNAWENENGQACYDYPMDYGFYGLAVGDIRLAFYKGWTAKGKDGVYSFTHDTGYTLVFTMQDNVLVSIEAKDSETSDGTYTAPAPVQDPVITLEVEGDGSGHFEDGWGQTVTSIEVPSGSLLYTQAEGTDPNNWFWIVNGDYIYAYRFVVDEGSEFTGWDPNYTEENPFTVTVDFTLRAKGK